MKKNSLYFIKFVTFLFATLMSSLALASNQNSLFVQLAPQATFKIINPTKHTAILTLEKVPPYLIYFTDRPIRKSGNIPLPLFLKLWQQTDKEGFKKNPPNAAIERTSLDAKTKQINITTLVAEVTNPMYDQHKQTLTYTLKFKQRFPHLESQSLEYTTLFFDPIYFNPGGF